MKKINDYSNFLNNIKFSYLDAIDMIKNISFEEGDVESKLKSVENDNTLPKFVYPFYEFIKFKQKIPSIQEFWKFYYELRPSNKKYFDKTNIFVEGTVTFEALKYRVSKTYPSLVREFLCILAVKDKFTDYEIIYNLDLDIYGGIDFLIKKENKYYGIKLFINTKESLYYANKKNNRHVGYIFDNVNYISLPFNIKSKNKLVINNFYLYSNEDLEVLLKQIK